MERWIALALRFFEDIQPILTDTDILLLKEKDVIAARDFLWRNLVTAYAVSLQRIIDEQIEIAYADLYGYDPRIQELFVEVVNHLNMIYQRIYIHLLNKTQEDVLNLGNRVIVTADLGNALRDTCSQLALECKIFMDKIVTPFRKEMIKLMEANDSKVAYKRIQLQSAAEILLDAIPIVV